ncbi:MAG: hypothetical protein GY928_32755 [Colwellia sp.]|nr:hypothetical protein [Colwellia sp.]
MEGHIFKLFRINLNILRKSKIAGTFEKNQYNNLNSAMVAYYNILGVYYKIGAHFLVALKSGRLLKHGRLL